jgi:hypothetical protein
MDNNIYAILLSVVAPFGENGGSVSVRISKRGEAWASLAQCPTCPGGTSSLDSIPTVCRSFARLALRQGRCGHARPALAFTSVSYVIDGVQYCEPPRL